MSRRPLTACFAWSLLPVATKEAHDQEVHDHTPWRKQFIGKNADSALELDTDIRNISGATLSCSHLTDNIRTLTRLQKTGQGGTFKTS